MASDNIAGVRRRGWKAVFLAPGMVIQWFNYMLVGNLKSYGKVRQQTRLSRSPFMTWVYSIGFYFLLVYFGIGTCYQASLSVDPGQPARTASTASLQSKCVELVLEKGTMDRASAADYCVKYYENN